MEVKITSTEGTHIFRRDWTTQVIKCTPWSTRLHPHPTIIKKIKTFLEVEGKIGPVPASQFRPPLRKDNVAEKRKRAAHKRFRPAAPKPTAMHPPLPEAPPNPKMMHQTASPHLQFHFAKALHGLVQAKCQAIYLKIETGCSCQTIWTIAMNIKLKMNLKMQPVSQALDPQSKKKKNQKQMTKLQKNAVGDQITLFANPRKKRKRAGCNGQQCHPNQNYKNHRLENPRL